MTTAEKKVITIAEIIQELIKGLKEKRKINLNTLKNQIASKYCLKSAPKLVDIIAAVPQGHRKYLIPRLMAKPIRTASGVSFN